MSTTYDDVWDCIFGSGCTSYSWWLYSACEAERDVRTGERSCWPTAVMAENPVTDGTVERQVTADDVMAAVHRIAAGQGGRYVGAHVIRECATVLADGWDDVDFDADMADQVLQVVMFGEVYFG